MRDRFEIPRGQIMGSVRWWELAGTCQKDCRWCQERCLNRTQGGSIGKDRIREHCGVFGISAADTSIQISQYIYWGLMSLQHRGQEAAGLSVTNGSRQVYTYKNNGLVAQVLTPEILQKYSGNVGIGHVRYGTAGSCSVINAQPYHFENNHIQFAMSFNGNIANYPTLRTEMEGKGRVFLTNSDTEIIANIIASTAIHSSNWIEILKLITKFLDGSYALLILTPEGDIYAMRDPMGFKPLVYGTLPGDQPIHVVSSETCAIDALGGKVINDVQPGEIIYLSPDGHVKSEGFVTPGTERRALCMFEFVYFARPDSVIDKISVYNVREKLGRNLAGSVPVPTNDAVIIPVPDSGRSAAMGFAKESGIPFNEGLIKNRYVWRTFITPGKQMRTTLVRQKLNPVSAIVKNRNVVLLDDSIVRGTTMRQIVRLLKTAGASSVHVRISCPPVRFPCFMGIDFPTREELIASSGEQKPIDDYVEGIRKDIGADTLGFQTIEGLVDAIGLPSDKVCLACLNGDYPLRSNPLESGLCAAFSNGRD